MAHVHDRWHKKDDTGKRVRTDRYGKGMRWQAVWTEPNGTRRKPAFATKDAAQAHLDEIAHLTRSGLYVSPEHGKILFSHVANQWLSHQTHQQSSSIDTIKRRLNISILPVLGDTPIGTITRTTIQDAVNEWTTRLAPSTVRLTYIYLSGILKHAAQARMIHTNPCTKINLPPESQQILVPLTEQDVQAVATVIWQNYRRLVAFMAGSGVRPGEGKSLTWDRVTPQRDGSARVKIDRQWSFEQDDWGPLKTRYSTRTLTIGPSTHHALGDRGDGLVFPRYNGGVMTRKDLHNSWAAAAKKVGIVGRGSWHALRHFHASVLISKGASPVAVAARLGHKDATETLKTYSHLWHDDDEVMGIASDGFVVF